MSFEKKNREKRGKKRWERQKHEKEIANKEGGYHKEEGKMGNRGNININENSMYVLSTYCVPATVIRIYLDNLI